MPDSTTQLRLDLGALETLVTELHEVHGSLKALADASGAIAEEVGCQDLADKVVDFSRSWDVHRQDLADDVKALADEIAKIVEGIGKTDQQLAASLTKPSST